MECSVQYMKMHGIEYFKITDAQRARLINNCKNTKYKLLQKETQHYGSATSLIYEEMLF